MLDLTWLRVGKSLYAGPSEVDSYRDAAEKAGYAMEWEEAPDWGNGAMKGTRVE